MRWTWQAGCATIPSTTESTPMINPTYRHSLAVSAVIAAGSIVEKSASASSDERDVIEAAINPSGLTKVAQLSALLATGEATSAED